MLVHHQRPALPSNVTDTRLVHHQRPALPSNVTDTRLASYQPKHMAVYEDNTKMGQYDFRGHRDSGSLMPYSTEYDEQEGCSIVEVVPELHEVNGELCLFEDLFVGDAGSVDALIARNRYGRQFTDALIEYTRLRGKVEREYAEGLAKLAKFEFPQFEPIMEKALKDCKTLKGTGRFDKDYKGSPKAHLPNIVEAMQKDLKKLAETQLSFARKIKKEIYETFLNSFAQQVGIKKKHKERLQMISKKVTEAMEHKDNTQKTFDRFSKTEKELAAKFERKSSESLRLDLLKVRQDLTAAEIQLGDAKRALTNETWQIDSSVQQAAKDIHESEIKRMSLTYQNLDLLGKLMQQQCRLSTKFVDDTLLNMAHGNIETELMDFAQKYTAVIRKKHSN